MVRHGPIVVRRPLCAVAASKGFGGGTGAKQPQAGGGGSKGRGAAAAPTPRRVKTADPDVQRAATLLLTALVAETDAEKRAQIARDNVDKIDGTFFAVADAYAQMARAEEGGGEEVATALEAAVKVALDAKQSTLRPEIRLLNRMLDAPGLEARRAVLEGEGGAGAQLLRDRGAREYLLSLLATLEKDVAAQQGAAQQKQQVGKNQQAEALRKAMEETRAIVQAAALASGGG
jgi:hypothetical protein